MKKEFLVDCKLAFFYLSDRVFDNPENKHFVLSVNNCHVLPNVVLAVNEFISNKNRDSFQIKVSCNDWEEKLLTRKGASITPYPQIWTLKVLDESYQFEKWFKIIKHEIKN